MKAFKCLVLLGWLFESASAKPSLIGSMGNTVAESSSKTYTLGGRLGLGHLHSGANINSAHSQAEAISSNLNSGYGISGSKSEATAESSSHTLGGGIGLGLLNVGANLNSAHSKAQFAALNSGFDLTGSHAGATAESSSHTIGGQRQGLLGFGANLNSAHAKAESNANSFIGCNRRDIDYSKYGGPLSQAMARIQAESGYVGFGPIGFGGNHSGAHSKAQSSATAFNSGFGTRGSHAEATATSQANSFENGLGYRPHGYGASGAQANAEAIATSQNEVRQWY